MSDTPETDTIAKGEWHKYEGACRMMERQRNVANKQRDELAEELRHLRGLLQEVTDNVIVPESSCSCHISPPCNDCVEHAGMRDLLETAKLAIARSERSHP